MTPASGNTEMQQRALDGKVVHIAGSADPGRVGQDLQPELQGFGGADQPAQQHGGGEPGGHVESPRQSLRTRKYSPNTRGVSLMPAATPTRKPLPGKPWFQRWFRASRSAAISPISRMLIWPNARVSRHGPRFSTARSRMAAAQRFRVALNPAGSEGAAPVLFGVPVPDAAHGDPDGHGGPGSVEERQRGLLRQPGQQAEEQGGERRVGERQFRPAGPAHGPAVEVRRRLAGLVEDLAAVPVDAEVEAVLAPGVEP